MCSVSCDKNHTSERVNTSNWCSKQGEVFFLIQRKCKERLESLALQICKNMFKLVLCRLLERNLS